jgi:putative spermidine/putrescine transport system ATP-binding protein
MTSGVRLEALSKRFGAVRALEHVSLDVEPGELVALLGGSGCGKTTLLRAVAGLGQPDGGRIWIGDRDVTNTPARARPIGMVFQQYALFPNLTVAGNVGFPLRIRRQSRSVIAGRVAELLSLVGLADFGARYPNELSGGQAQRVSLARALAAEPEVLLLDEPLSALDAVIRTSLRDEIRRIQQQVGITALFVTHDQAEAMAIADRVAVMDQGRIVEVASPARIYEEPAERFTALFVGARNALEVGVSPDRMVRWGGLELPAPAGANGSALVVFRPEDAELVDRGGVEGIVEVAVFLGSVTRVRLVVDGHHLAVDAPSGTVSGLRPGSTVRLAVKPGAARTFPA